ncbi:MAG: hypothetical protein IPM12_05765 [Flavobacteriales bacterium]|nr:hypothetical protein [Flavobacteriales bacterium]
MIPMLAESSFAQASASEPGARRAANTSFEENKGQVRTQHGDPSPEVRYSLQQGGTTIFLLGNGIAYQFNRVHHAESSTGLMRSPLDRTRMDGSNDHARLETYRMDMVLEGAAVAPHITAEGRSSDYTNYYQHDALGVHCYSRIVYHDVYPGIDLVFHTTEKGMKYDFIVHAGADPAAISMRFKDHEELRLDSDGRLIHGNRMGRFIEERPMSFQGGAEIPTRFALKGDRLSFTIAEYDRTRTLVIDPPRVWGTYYGGPDEDLGSSCAVGPDGSVYLAGHAFSTSAIASGGHQNTLDFGPSAFLVKFAPDGTRIWGTYYSGNSYSDYPSCAVDASGNVYLAGRTGSTSGIAIGGHQNISGGDDDAFLVKFDAAGARLWGTYYGGTGQDFADWDRACAVDASGNVYLRGGTNSSSAIASGGHQNALGGSYDAFLVKFSPDGARLWGTYYGGAGYDRAWSCAIDPGGSVYMSGETMSTSGIASGGHQGPIGGGTDAFLVKLAPDGTRIWGTYYGGAATDVGWSCAVEGSPNGHVYLAGWTTSTTGIAAGGYQNALSGSDEDAFLVKFDSDGGRVWGTYYGGPSLDGGLSCAVEEAVGGVYLAGRTYSASGISSGGYQISPGGGADAFLARFHPDGTRNWATYYGGSDQDGGYSCATDPNGHVYLAGTARSSSGIASDGHQNTLGGPADDAFLVKLHSWGSLDVEIAARVLLEGPYSTVTGLMGDALRAASLLPTTEPYTALGYTYMGSPGAGGTVSGDVFASVGNDAIVDWVLVELRGTSGVTTLRRCAAMVQRDGDVVALDGSSPVRIQANPGSYRVAIRHRNHLGVMTGSAVALGSTPPLIDFTSTSMSTYGGGAQRTIGSKRVLWPGETTGDGVVKYIGANNDRDPILVAIGGSTPTNTVSNVYSPLDVNMDGQIKYIGANNDRDVILTTIGGSTPNAVRVQQLP